MYRILVSGYYGFNNIGDEAILKGIIDGLKSQKEDIEIVVLSQYPGFTKKKHDVKSVKRMNPFSVIKEIMSCDLLLSGGGSLLQDVTSKRSIRYYLSLIGLAKLFGKKVMVYSQGIGPVQNPSNRRLMKKVLDKVELINVRDENSKVELEEMGVSKDVFVSVDTVFGVKRPSLEIGRDILQEIGIRNEKPTIGISIRPWKENKNIVDSIKRISEEISKKYDCNILFIPCHFYSDLGIIRELYAKIDKVECQNIYVLDKYLYVDEYLSLVGNLKAMIGMRLHALIFSALMEVPMVGISYDPKIDSFMELIGKKSSSSVDTIDEERILADVDRIIEDNEGEREKLRRYNEEFTLKVSEHNKRLMGLLKREEEIEQV